MNPVRTVAAAAALALCVGASACSRSGSEEHFYQWSESLPPGAVVHLRDGVGNIDVRRATGQQIVVDGSRRWHHGRARDVRFVVSHDGNDYYVCAMWRSSGKCGESGYRGRHVGGLLMMFSLFHRSTDATADMVVDLPANVPVDATTMNGSVRVDGATSGVIAKTMNGTVEARNVSGPLALTTMNGDVRLSADSLADADSIHLRTINGSIKAELPSSLQGDFDLSVVNGMVHSDFPVSATSSSTMGRPPHHLQGQIGSSTRVVMMRAVNGMISVVSRSPGLIVTRGQ